MKNILTGIICALLISTLVGADVITGGGGLTKVIHDGTLTGNGTSSSPLSAAGGVISGLTTGRIPKATSSTTIGDSTGATVIGQVGTDNTLVNGYAGIGGAPDPNVGLKIFKPSGATYGLVVSSGATNFIEDLAVNGNTTLGNSTADSTAINGTTQIADDGNAFSATSTVSAGTSSFTAATPVMQGTYDTTAGVLTASALRANAVSTRSAGANNLTNVGMWTSASGAQVNQALVTDQGDNVLNNTSGSTTANLNFLVNGNTTLGNATTDTTTINGATTVAGPSNGNTLTTNATATAQTVGTASTRANNSGTYNTTGGALSSYAMLASNTATRSAGANNLNNVGIYADSSGGQTNTAIYADHGDVTLNALSGVTDIWGVTTMHTSCAVLGGITSTGAANSFDTTTVTNSTGAVDSLLVNQTATAQISSINGITVSDTASFNTTATSRTTYGVKVTNTNTISSGANTLTSVALDVTNTSTATGSLTPFALVTETGDNVFNNTTGQSTFKGSVLVSDTNGAGSTSLTSNTAPSAGTSATSALSANNTGTYNTTSGAIAEFAGQFSNTATRSAGANNLTNTALDVTASGAQINVAINTKDGDVNLNTASGNLTIGGSANSPHIKATDTSQRPTVANCGTTPTVIGTDSLGMFTTTATPTASCAVTFHTAFGSNVDCNAWATTGSQQTTFVYTVGTGGITAITAVGGGALGAGVKIHWQCFDH